MNVQNNDRVGAKPAAIKDLRVEPKLLTEAEMKELKGGMRKAGGDPTSSGQFYLVYQFA